MDDLYLDALGITDEDDVAALKGTKKKKGKKIDDLDFMPKIKPIVETGVPKVVSAIRQTQSKKVLLNILTRVKITEDQAALRQIMRLRGYSVMKNVLDEFSEDYDLMEMVLQCLKTWPLLNRNKVDDSMISGSVEALLEKHEQESFKTLAQELLDHWASLPVYSRIPKVAYRRTADSKPYVVVADGYQDARDAAERERTQVAFYEARAKEAKKLADKQKELRLEQLKKEAEKRAANQPPRPAEDQRPAKRIRVEPIEFSFPKPPPPPVTSIDASAEHKQTPKEIIASAAAKAEEERLAAVEAAEKQAQAEAERAERHARRKAKAAAKKSVSAEEKAAKKQKRLIKLVGEEVVKCMNKYSKGILTREQFKKYAKELTQVISGKEKKSLSYKDDRLEKLSDDKKVKIKKFSKDFIAKVLRKLEERAALSGKNGNGNHRPSMTPTNATASSSTHTPKSVDGGDVSIGGVGMGMGDVSMSVEEAMDLDPDSESDHDDDAEGDAEEDFEGDEANGLTLDRGDGDGETMFETMLMQPPRVKRPIDQLPLERTEDGMDYAAAAPLHTDYGGPGWEATADPRRRGDFMRKVQS